MSEDKKNELEELDVQPTEEVEKPETDEVENVEATEPIIEEEKVMAGVSRSQFERLTNKNKQFMVNVDKQLSSQLHYEVQERVYAEMIETLINGQATSQTARQIYGTPTETVQVILEQEFPDPAKQPVEKSPDWQIAVDGGLVLGSLFTFITGLSMMNAEEGASTAFMGLTTLIINYLVAGVAMLITSKVMPDLDAPKGERRLWRYFGVSILAMFGWFLIVSMSAVLIPSVLNPTFTPMTYMIIAAVTFGARYLFKRHYNIQGGVF
ncbi:DUF1129 domain-containing protein [Aerococcaceae bacterium WGS1372]